MPRQPAARRTQKPEPSGQPRRIPSQQRGRQRFEKILSVAMELIEKHGSDGLKMSEIVERAELSFGALYQYFPDKTSIIRTLAERFNDQGRQCVEDELARVKDVAGLTPALCNVADAYYAFFRSEPVMRDIWHATHTDKLLQQVDAEDTEYHAQTLFSLMHALWPEHDERELLSISRLTMQLLAAAVRYAVSLDEEEGAAALTLYKRMLPADLGRLIKG